LYLAHNSLVVTYTDIIAYPDRPLKQNYDTTDKISDNFLQAETDTYTQGCKQPLKFCPFSPQNIQSSKSPYANNDIAGDCRDGITAA